MNPATEEEAIELAKATDRAGLVVFPPFIFMEEVGNIIDESRLGAQDLFWEKGTGPYTGEISAKELKDVGVSYVIIGHSERRKLGETNEIVAQKLKAAVQAGLMPILCVGETLEQKEENKRDEIITEEITSAFDKLSEFTNIYIAYEPIWAISTSKSAKADKAKNTLEVINLIKKLLRKINKEALEHAHFIYGGSVNSQNAKNFLQHKEIEGALIGGASLKPEDINEVMRIAVEN